MRRIKNEKNILHFFTSNNFFLGIAFYYKISLFPKEMKPISCNPNEKSTFFVNYKTSNETNFSQFNKNPEKLNFELNGEISEICLNSADNLEFLFDFSKIQVKSNSSILNINSIEPNFAFVNILVSNIGEIIQIKSSQDIEPLLLNLYKEYVKNSFANFKNYNGSGKIWENELLGFEGKSKYSYNFLHSGILQRRFVDDLPNTNSYVINTGKNVEKKYSSDSITSFTLDKRNLSKKISMIRKSKTYLNNRMIAEENTIFEKNVLTEKQTSALDKKILNSLVSNDLKGEEINERLMKKVLLENFKFKDFSSFLNSYTESKKENETEYFLQLKSLMSLNQNTFNEILNFTNKNSISNTFQNILISAAISLGTPESQSFLIELFNQEKDLNRKIVILGNLGNVEHPSKNTEDFIFAQLNPNNNLNLYNTAELALGNIASNLKNYSPEREVYIFNSLLNILKENPNSIKRQVTIYALGNYADSKILETLKQELSSSDEDVRKAAVYALRFINLAEPDDLLAKVLRNEKRESVTLSALEAISFRKQRDDIVSLERILLHESPSELIRMQVLKNFSLIGLQNEINYAKNYDSAKSIRTYAENLLLRFKYDF
ncbi:HEAT repeat domain-containing protein [Pigmentibacter sp. JX0631]|uniref:HEAT repeat domain-containing protein n=1 Tax=Pigmentibacter sp. JX0631 TaxID=2976982 RepID=UPI0024695214|nr:HEAT repeat domain-containing protein [Pigmentibacter sp. JX0631]WGL61172.1 HEAT repeat domain-containing protein [Pigmentibacter sp. JX0631]